jgi:putative ABC transport system permease protein
MKNPLRKRFKRDLISNSGRYFAIFVMMTVTIAIMSGFLAVSDGAQKVLNENRINCKLEDGSFTAATKISAAAQAETEKLGVSVYQNDYVNEKLPDEATLRVYPDREQLDLVTVIAGRTPVNEHEIAVDRLFAENNGLDLGASLIINETPMIISGLISVPDYSSLFKNNSDLMMDSFHFGIGVISSQAFQRFPATEIVTSYSYRFDNRDLTEKEKRKLSTEIKDKLVANGTILTNFVTAENNQSISFIDDDMGSDVPMMKVFLSLIILIMAFVFAIVITSTIEAEAPIIGTLLASGYTKYELIRHYLTMSIAVTLASALVGNLIGYTIMPDFFKLMYYGSYSLPPMTIELNLEALLLTTVLPIAMMIGINFIALNRKLSISPLRFLRKELKQSKSRRAVKLPHVSFFNRFRLRVIIQNKGSYITLFVGVFLASFILMFGLVITPMISHYVESIKQSAVSDYQYLLKGPVEPENPGNAEKMTCATLETYYRPAGKNIEVSFSGLRENSDYFTALPLTEDENGGYLSDGLAKKLGAKPGDTLAFVNPYTDQEYSVKVLGFIDYPGALTVFMNQQQLNALLERAPSYFNGYLSDQELKFTDKNSLATVITPDDMAKFGDQMLSSFTQLAPLCLFAAIVIYLVLMVVLTKLVIDKNALCISYLKVFGYEPLEIRRIYLRATTIVVLGSLLLCLPLVSLGIQGCFLAVQMKLSGYLPVYIPAYLYAEIVAIGMAAYFIINFIHVRRINKIQLSAALKNRE